MNLGLLFLVFAAAYAADDLPWWKTEVFYQIYPRSFKDSNKDGIGDLQGITDNVDYLKSLGIGAIWLSPIYASPNADYGYDVSDYKDINKEYGDMDSFKKLMTKLNDKKIKLIMDFIPNHTSEKHPWFLQSKNRTAGYEDYYIWKDGVGVKKSPPTNWLSMDGSSAWQWCEERNQYYYHVFSPSQPDLNYSNPKVLEEMKGVMDFWLHEGVSGFRMDAVPYLVETDFKDENKICSDPIYDCLNHTYTKDTESTHAILHEFTQHLEKYKEDNNLTTLFMVLEATSPMDQIVKYYDNDTIPFNFNLMGLKENSSAGEFVNQIKSWIDGVTDERWSNWFTGNHDSQRAASRFDRDLTDALNMIIMLLPGTPFTYYGEEIAMKDVELKNFTDIRMKSRTPFQWDGTPHAGFTTGTPWLPVSPDYWETNKDTESSATKSHLSVYKQLVQLHKDIIKAENFSIYYFSDYVFGFSRELKNNFYIVVVNLDNEDFQMNLNATLNSEMNKPPKDLFVHVSSVNSGFKTGDKISLGDNAVMRPRSGIVLSNAVASGAISIFATPSVTLILLTLVTTYIFGAENK